MIPPNAGRPGAATAVASELEPGTPQLWRALESLVDRSPSLSDLREHRLQFVAARRWADTGRDIPPTLDVEKTVAAALTLPVRVLLARVAAAWGGPAVILKGPELAARYPEDVLRPAGDIDLLVDDAHGAHAALRAAGFVTKGDPRRYVDIHHLQPLVWPGLPVRIELHHAPKWIEGLEPPSTQELLGLTLPARGEAEGFLALTPEAHAVVLAVHSWAHEPLGSLRDLLDIGLVLAEADPGVADELARRWGVVGVWRTTREVVEALYAGGSRPLALRLWARHLESARGRTVAGSHLEAWLSPFWALSPGRAAVATVRHLVRELRPVPGELWRTKLRRAVLAIRNARLRRSAHHRQLANAQLATPPELLLDRLERRRARAMAGRVADAELGDGEAR